MFISTPLVKKAVVIYHKDCMDGFGSAWAFHVGRSKDYEEVEYIPMGYEDDPLTKVLPYLDVDLYILDFSFSRNRITTLSELANSVVILDHHKTAQEALTDWDDQPKNCEIFFDMSRSGCMMTWNYFYMTNPPALIRYINDRDLWLFDLPYSKDISAVIAITPKELPAYSILASELENEFIRVRDIGSHLLYQHQDICEQIVRDARPIRIDTGKELCNGLACNCTPQFSSEVGNILAKKSGSFGATYHSNSRGEVKWSLRSIGDYDVSAIAKAFMGGGHRNAAGFTVHLNLAEGVDPGRIVLRSVGDSDATS